MCVSSLLSTMGFFLFRDFLHTFSHISSKCQSLQFSLIFISTHFAGAREENAINTSGNSTRPTTTLCQHFRWNLRYFGEFNTQDRLIFSHLLYILLSFCQIEVAAASVAETATYPLDLLKTRLQIQGEAASAAGKVMVSQRQ